jgi:hypothetical protein
MPAQGDELRMRDQPPASIGWSMTRWHAAHGGELAAQ